MAADFTGIQSQNNNQIAGQDPAVPSVPTGQIRNKTTDGSCWIVPEREIDKKIEIMFAFPEIAWDRTADIQTIKIVGRNNPFYQYSGGETLINITLDFHAQEESREDVLRTCRFLESLMANDGRQNPPQRIRLIYGRVFRDEMWVIKNCKYKLSNFDKPYGYMPKQAYVDLSLALDTKTNLTTAQIRRI